MITKHFTTFTGGPVGPPVWSQALFSHVSTRESITRRQSGGINAITAIIGKL